MKKIDVVFTIDIGYIRYFTVACTSLLETNKNIGRIFLVHDIQDSSDLKKAISYFKENYDITVEELRLDSEIFENYNISHHFSKAIYFRLLLSDIIPSDVEEILFLDSDIIVNGDLSKLLEIDFIGNPKYIYACDHKYSSAGLDRFEKLGFQKLRYFNAGVMYINLLKWRKDNITIKLLENEKKYKEDLIFWDQDILNMTFYQQWGELAYEYNAFGLTEYNNTKDYKIIHYTGTSKPWHLGNNHPYKHLYWKYQSLTPFKRNFPESWTYRNITKALLPNSLRNFLKKYR